MGDSLGPPVSWAAEMSSSAVFYELPGSVASRCSWVVRPPSRQERGSAPCSGPAAPRTPPGQEDPCLLLCFPRGLLWPISPGGSPRTRVPSFSGPSPCVGALSPLGRARAHLPAPRDCPCQLRACARGSRRPRSLGGAPSPRGRSEDRVQPPARRSRAIGPGRVGSGSATSTFFLPDP